MRVLLLLVRRSQIGHIERIMTAETDLHMRLLIVDNDDTMREVIGRIVSRPGDELAECNDSSGVISAFRSFRPDWVLMDVRMPGKNGIEATRELKRLFPDARVAMVSNFGGIEFREEAKAAGAEKYFLKDNLSVIRPSLEER